MKITKYLLGLALVAVSLTSCDKDNEAVIYNSAFNNVTWEIDEIYEETSAESVTIPVVISRNKTAGALTVNFTEDASEEGIFTTDGNGSVTFADGKGMAVVNVTASNLQKGKDYTYTLTLPENVVDADTNTNSAVQAVEITVHCDYTWVSAGTATFIDGNFYDEPPLATVQVIQALEQPERFRLVQPYQAVGQASGDSDDIAYFKSSGDIEFVLYKPDSAEAKADPSNIGYFLGGVPFGSYTFVYHYASMAYAGYCSFTLDGDEYICEHLLQSGTSLYFGGFSFKWNRP